MMTAQLFLSEHPRYSLPDKRSRAPLSQETPVKIKVFFCSYALGYQRLDGHLISQDDISAPKHAADIPQDTDNIMLALMVAAKEPLEKGCYLI
ncbi:hypothetical protein KQS06HV_370002 [Klebsiella quasipneumoniae subsp. similipneumoniae]|nr:hypothetical protein KQS06HV_370002 [Klebsiella quasipneumoniae subsp. similipneumoniae]